MAHTLKRLLFMAAVTVACSRCGLSLAQAGSGREPPRLVSKPPQKMDFGPDKIQMPVKKIAAISGRVVDGELDTSPAKLETVARGLREQSAAMQSGDNARVQELNRRAESDWANVLAPSRPLPHATVSLCQQTDRAASGVFQSTTADEQGKFEFFDVPQGLYRIVAKDTRKGTNACPAAELSIEHGRACGSVRIVVYPETVTVKGCVTDSTGRPVTNATVTARQGHERHMQTEVPSSWPYHEVSAVTDDSGRYELRGLIPAGVWDACGLYGGGYGGADVWYTLRIEAPGYVSAKAYVPIVPEETRQASQSFAEHLKALAGAHEKARSRAAEPVKQPPCQGYVLTEVDFPLFKPGCVEGHFVGQGGLPQPGCEVHLSSTNRMSSLTYQAFTECDQWGRCDNEGRFRFFGVAPGDYKVEAYQDHRVVSGKPARLVTVKEGETVTGLSLVNDALPCGKIVGVVADAESGRPVNGLTVYATHKETGSTVCPPFLCLCGKEGYHTDACKRWIEQAMRTNDLRVSTFIVEKAAPGKIDLRLKAPSYAEEQVTVDVAPEAVVKREIKLWRSGAARIRPAIANGAGVDQYASVPGNPPLIHYVAVPEGGGTRISGGRPSKQPGYDEFTGLKPGRYMLRGDVRYLKGGVARFEAAPLTIASDQTSEVALDFSGSCQLELKTDFPPGTAVSIRLETADTPAGQKPDSGLGLKASAYLREPGSVLIPDLKPGVYRLSLFRRDVHPAKNAAEKKEPDETRMITLKRGEASPSLVFRF